MNSETLDILDFTELSQEAVKAKQREERVQRLAQWVTMIKLLDSSPLRKPSAIKNAVNCFLSEV